MKVTGAGIKNGAIGIAIIAAIGGVAWIVNEVRKAGGVVGQAISDTADAVGASAFTLINGDPNAKLQAPFSDFLSAWKAAGSPPAGSPLDTALRQQYGQPPATAAEIAANGGG